MMRKRVGKAGIKGFGEDFENKEVLEMLKLWRLASKVFVKGCRL